MKKKTIIIGLCLASCLGITGCGSSQDAVVSNLSNQIDFLNNTVDSTNRNMKNVSNISFESSDAGLRGAYQSAKAIYNNQTSYKTAITTKNAMIKKALTNKELKLTDQDKKALIDLTTALSKNTRSLDESRSELVRAMTDVKRNYNDKNASVTQTSAKINRLSNCMNSQSSYYKNLLNTLNNIEKILDIDDSSFDYNDLNTLDEGNKKEDNSNNMQELIYNYLLNDLNNKNNSATNSENSCNNGACPSEQNYNNCPNGICPPANNNVSGRIVNNSVANGVNNGINNGFNNGFYANNYNRITNPSRNTDTFQPINKNIDTYRPYGPRFNNTPLANNEIATADIHPSPVDDTTDIRRNSNTNQVDNSQHRRRPGPRGTSRKNNLETNDLIADSVSKVKEIDLEKNDNKKQIFAGKTEKIVENQGALSLDINQKVRDLIKKKDKETFNNTNFLILH